MSVKKRQVKKNRENRWQTSEGKIDGMINLMKKSFES